MYAYREYLTLAEAANVLGVDEQTLFQRAMYPMPNISFPRIGFKACSSGFVFCRDNIESFFPEFSMNEDSDNNVKDFISGMREGKIFDFAFAVNDGYVLYLKRDVLLSLIKRKTINIGWQNWDILFSRSEIFYSGSINVEIHAGKDFAFDETSSSHHENLFGQCQSIGYSSMGISFLKLSDLVVLARDVYNCKKQIDENNPLNDNRLPALREKQIEDLTLKISDIERLFDPRMQRVLKPIAEAIHQFSDSNVYQKFQDKKASATLSQVKEWVKCNSYFKDDRTAELVKNLINEYYTLKNI